MKAWKKTCKQYAFSWERQKFLKNVCFSFEPVWNSLKSHQAFEYVLGDRWTLHVCFNSSKIGNSSLTSENPHPQLLPGDGSLRDRQNLAYRRDSRSGRDDKEFVCRSNCGTLFTWVEWELPFKEYDHFWSDYRVSN